MAIPGEDCIPAELVERWVTYVELSREVSFRQICTKANTSTIASAIQPFFTTWRTSLMCSSLERLISMSIEHQLCAHLRTLLIEDDSSLLDPWVSSELPYTIASYDIWPRSGAGIVTSSQIGTAKLMAMLRERILRPETIKIRDYQIAELNLKLYPEIVRTRRQNQSAPARTPCRSAIAALTRDIVDGANLAVTSLVIRHINPNTAKHWAANSSRSIRADTSEVLASPVVSEAIIELSAEHQGEDVGFPSLRSAALSLGTEATSYWLEQMFHNAPALQSLKLSIGSPRSILLDATRVVPQLTDFELSHTTVSAKAIIAMLTCSKGSLTCIRLRQVNLEEGSTWRELLSFIGSEFRMLSSFSLRVLREVAAGSTAIDFRKLRKGDVPERCRSGLELAEMGPFENRRVTKLSYSGPDAGIILDLVSRCGREGIPD